MATYQIELIYDKHLGRASYTWTNDTLNLVSTVKTDSQFLGWYVNSQYLNNSPETIYTPVSDCTIEARFQKIYAVTSDVSGPGNIQFERGIDKNTVTFSVIPDSHYHFTKYRIYGAETDNKGLLAANEKHLADQTSKWITAEDASYSETTVTPLNLQLQRDISIVAYFEEDNKYHITATTDFSYGSVYISDNDVYSGTTVTIFARPFTGYIFNKWSDGNTSNPRTIIVNDNITIVGEFLKKDASNDIYQYRCFVKDQHHLTDSPKAFMVTNTADLKRDLMTNAVSNFEVLDPPDNINNGDILVLHTPKGEILYSGVITSIEPIDEGTKYNENKIKKKSITCSQMQSFYAGTWIYNVSPQDYLEHEIAVLLQDYAAGKIYKSEYTDPLVARRLGGITIDYVGSTQNNLPTDTDEDGNENLTEYDMEDWIYDLYDKYGIVFDFEINFSGPNYVHIKVPNYDKLIVGNNTYAITDMSPITTIEETNRMILFAADGTYRTTVIVKKDGTTVENPESMDDRFDVTNTVIVYSDDPLEDLIANNLPKDMMNHQLTFTLIVKNFIYSFNDFKLGGPLDIYHNDDYYDSVLTGYEISKEANQDITEVYFICGKVRKKLTQLLTLKKI